MEINKKIVYVDMDGVICDFQSALNKVHPDILRKYEGNEDNIPGLFGMMDPIKNAVECLTDLSNFYDIYILSTAPWENPISWMDKVNWIKNYFGDIFKKKLILTHHKNLCKGDYMIDDRDKHGVTEFGDGFIHFGTSEFPEWMSVYNYLMKKYLEENKK